MTPQQIIEIVNNAKSYVEVFPDLFNYKTTFVEYIKQIHTDVCKLEGADKASSKLIEFKDLIENGKEHKDDAGIVTYFPDHCLIKGDKKLLKVSLDNYKKLVSFKSTNDLPFRKYLPKQIEFEGDNLKISFDKRAIPLSFVGKLPQEHVNWILSRLLEICGWFDKIGYSHAGLNLDSVYIVPENHGIMIVSFYHLTKIEQNLKTISGRYKSFYPYIIFAQKKATSFIDIELSKRIATFLLGDPSGNGTMLLKTFNKDFINFLLTYDTRDSFCILKTYRELLNKNFEKKFYSLII